MNYAGGLAVVNARTAEIEGLQKVEKGTFRQGAILGWPMQNRGPHIKKAAGIRLLGVEWQASAVRGVPGEAESGDKLTLWPLVLDDDEKELAAAQADAVLFQVVSTLKSLSLQAGVKIEFEDVQVGLEMLFGKSACCTADSCPVHPLCCPAHLLPLVLLVVFTQRPTS